LPECDLDLKCLPLISRSKISDAKRPLERTEATPADDGLKAAAKRPDGDKMGHGAESNVPWGTRTAMASARKLPSIRASQEVAIGMAMGFVGACGTQ
jgi:hypothetical protein